MAILDAAWATNLKPCATFSQDDIDELILLAHLFSSPVQHPLGKTLKYYPASDVNNELQLPTFAPTSSPFKPEEVRSLTFQLDPPPRIIGIEVEDDTTFNMPYVKRVIPATCAFRNIPPGFRCNKFILVINGKSPITKKFALELLRSVQRRKVPLELEYQVLKIAKKYGIIIIFNLL